MKSKKEHFQCFPFLASGSLLTWIFKCWERCSYCNPLNTVITGKKCVWWAIYYFKSTEELYLWKLNCCIPSLHLNKCLSTHYWNHLTVNVEKSNLAVTVKLFQLESSIWDHVYLGLHLEITQAFISPFVREAHFVCHFCSGGFNSWLLENTRENS